MTFCYLGHYYNQIDADKVRAEKCFQKSIELDIGNSEATEALIQLMLEKGNELAAKQLLSNYCEANPQNSWAHKQLGVILLNMNKIRDAIDHFHMSLRSNDKDDIVWECLGECFYRDGKIVAALKALKRASDLTDETNSSCHYLTGHIQMVSGLFSEAIESFDKVLKLQPNHLPSLTDKAQSYYYWTQELYTQGSFGACYDVLERSISFTIEAISKQADSHLLHKILGDLSIFALQTFAERTHAKTLPLLQTYASSSFSSSSTKDLPYFEVSSKITFETVKDDAPMIFLKSALRGFLSALSLVSGGNKTLLSAYYNDVAVTIFKAHLISGDAALRDLAIQLGKMNVGIAPSWGMTWNALGVFLCDSDPIRSQHSFIKSVQLERKVILL
jgi:superkiller protein 3